MQQETILKINQLRNFAYWTRSHTKLAALLDIDFWYHTYDNSEKITYRIWVENIINESSQNIDHLIARLPEFMDKCYSIMECAA